MWKVLVVKINDTILHNWTRSFFLVFRRTTIYLCDFSIGWGWHYMWQRIHWIKSVCCLETFFVNYASVFKLCFDVLRIKFDLWCLIFIIFYNLFFFSILFNFFDIKIPLRPHGVQNKAPSTNTKKVHNHLNIAVDQNNYHKLP